MNNHEKTETKLLEDLTISAEILGLTSLVVDIIANWVLEKVTQFKTEREKRPIGSKTDADFRYTV